MKKVNFNHLAQNWLLLKQLSVKHSTYVKYEAVLKHHILPYFKKYNISEINNEMIVLFFDERKKDKLSSSTLHSIKNILSSIIEYGVDNYTMNHVNFKQIKIPADYKTKQVLSKKDRDKIIKYAQKEMNALSIAMLLALYGGLRLGEICALKWEHIDLDNQVLQVEGTVSRLKCKEKQNKKTELVIQTPKSHSSYREVPLPCFLIEYLKRYHISRCGDYYVLSNTLKLYEPRRLEKKFYNFCNEFDIQCNFHNLRHSFATDCVRNNVEIKALSEILGHSNVSITLDLYVHTSLEQKIKEINKIKTPYLFVD